MGGHLRSIKHGWFALRLSVAAEKPGEVKAGECPAFFKAAEQFPDRKDG